MSFSNLLSSRISGDGGDGLAGMLQKRLNQNKSKRWVRKGDKNKKEEKQAKREKRKREEEEPKADEQRAKKKSKKETSSLDYTDIAENLMSEKDVKLRLRELKEPIMFFGETHAQRLKRLKKVELLDAERKQTGSKGQKNDYQKVVMAEVDKELELLLAQGENHVSNKKNKEKKYDKPRTKNECEFMEDYVLYFFKRLIREWAKHNQSMPEYWRRSVAGRKKQGLQGQCRLDMRHLFKLLKKRKCSSDVVMKLVRMVDCCMDRNYIGASRIYFELAIGNAPWPVGVTASGIHERAGQTKIHEHEVAHVLNNETQRKYIHAIERIMKFAQEIYPSSDATKNFNVDQDRLSKLIK